MSELTGSNQRCHAQFKCVQTVVGQRFAGNGPNGLSYYYYYIRHRSHCTTPLDIAHTLPLSITIRHRSQCTTPLDIAHTEPVFIGLAALKNTTCKFNGNFPLNYTSVVEANASTTDVYMRKENILNVIMYRLMPYVWSHTAINI